MKSTLSDAHMAYLANLARLKLTNEEQVSLKKSLEQTIHYMETLKNLDLSNVKPMMRVDESLKPLRKDIEKPSLSYKETFKNAPDVEQGHFSVPKTL